MQVKETRNNPRPGDGTPGPGRPKGVPNKSTALLKDAILKAGEIAGGGEPDGLVNYLVAQAKQNPGPFMTLLGKVLPTQVSGEDDKELRITIRNIMVEPAAHSARAGGAAPATPVALKPGDPRVLDRWRSGSSGTGSSADRTSIPQLVPSTIAAWVDAWVRATERNFYQLNQWSWEDTLSAMSH